MTEWLGFAPRGFNPSVAALDKINQKRLVYRINDDIKQALFPKPTEEEVAENGPFADINPYLPDDARRYISSYINLYVTRGLLSYFEIVELVSNPSEFRAQIFIQHRSDKANWASEFTISKRFNNDSTP